MPIQVQPFDFGAGLKNQARADRQVTLQELALQNQQQQQGIQNQQADRNFYQDQANQSNASREKIADALPQVIAEGIKVARTLPEGSRVAGFQQTIAPFLQRAQELGIPVDELTQTFSKMTDKDLLSSESDKFIKGATVTVAGEDGAQSLQTNLINNRTGESRLSSVPLQGELVSKLGETGAEETGRKIDEARGKESAKREVGRLDDAITEGMMAADALPTVNRAISLIEGGVKTGGVYSKASFEFARSLGIEDPDKGELSNLLGKAVLSQLRTTFGAAFTAEEGNSLKEIEASLGTNPVTNLRLLNNAKATALRSANRGLEAARKERDEFAAKQIEAAMNEILGGQQGDDAPLTPEEQAELAEREARNANP